MPLIRVSDQVHEHLKQLGQEQQPSLSVDAVLRKVFKIAKATKAREYISRGGLMPLPIYRWLILSTWADDAGSTKDNPKPQTRRMLLEHMEKDMDCQQLKELFPNDFTYTPNPKGARLRWKMRFTNVVREMVKTGILFTSPTNDSRTNPEYMVDDDVMRRFLRMGLHLDTTDSMNQGSMADGWWFTKLPEGVHLGNWRRYTPLTINSERHNPFMIDNEYTESLDMFSFIWGKQLYGSLRESSLRPSPFVKKPVPEWFNPKFTVSTGTHSGFKGYMTQEESRDSQSTSEDVEDSIEEPSVP